MSLLSTPPQAAADQLAGDDKERAEQQWREYLEGLEAQPFPSLPSLEYKPQPNETIDCSISELQWPENISTSTAIQAAWSILAAQYTGASEALLGLLPAGRQHQPAESTDSAIPVRITLQLKESVSQFLDRVQQQSAKISSIGQLNVEQIGKLSGDSERATRFQTLLDLSPQQPFADIKSKPEATITASSQRALVLECQPAETDLSCRFTYDRQVLDQEQMRRAVHQFEHVLRQLCAPQNATQPLADLDFTSDRDLETIWTWNATVPETVDECVHDLIQEAVQRQPAAPAICAWDGELSYGELDQLSTQLARHLVSLGVGRNAIVPLCFEKSMWTPVAQVAVMKAGAASVAMDSRQPEERLRGIVEQTGASVIICSSMKKDLASQLNERLTVVEVDRTALSRLEVSEAPLPIVKPEDTLYINFTSGSTGKPKGAIITHRNFASAIQHQRDILRVDSTTRVYDFVSYAFDVMWGCLLHTLAAGACLCIPSDDDRQTRIAESMRSLRVNYAHLTPTVARLLDPSSLPDLHTLCLAGEALMRSDRTQWTPHVTLLNLYGPAECTVFSTGEEILPSEEAPRIGQGIGLSTWVVSTDGTNKLVPVGGIGELVLEGPLVGSGYLADSAKTDAVFIQNPSWLLQGGPGHAGRTGRLYKTGDLVRYDSNGALTYFGRKDTQVKISGQRVELGDIEHHLRESLMNDARAQIATEVVTPLKKDRPILVTFLEIEAENGNTAEFSESEMKAWVLSALAGVTDRLSKVLPAHMVPSAYVPLARMPMTATGKTDRRRLREIGGAMTLEQLIAINPNRKNHRAPTTETEQLLQQLWASTLGIEASSIGLDDSFLQIGGDSIAAMRLVGAARKQGLSLTVAEVLKQPRLENVAATVAAKKEMTDERAAGASEIETRISSPYATSVFPVTNFQHLCIEGALRTPKSWWDYRYLDFPEDTDPAKLIAACRGLWARFDILRTIFISSQGRFLQLVPPAADEPPVIIRETDEETDADFKQMCEKDDATPVALGTCFTQFFITKSSRGPTRLTWRLSHAQFDGMSAGLILQGLRAAFEGEDIVKGPQFSDFLSYSLKQGAPAFDHWKSVLQDSTMTMVPTTLLDTDERNPVAITTTTSLPRSADSSDTPATIFTAACAIALAKVTKTSDVVFGRVVSGRFALDEDLQSVVGPCVGIVPVRVKFDGTPSIKAAQTTIQSQHVDGLSYETIGLSGVANDLAREELAFTDFGFSAQYQNVDVNPTVQIGGNTCHIGGYQKRDIRVGTNASRVEVLAKPRGDNLDIRMISRNHTRPELEELLQEICAAMV